MERRWERVEEREDGKQKEVMGKRRENEGEKVEKGERTERRE